ncbi:PadR family transcriptional regulator [Lachnospiraceae bacterium 62-35]
MPVDKTLLSGSTSLLILKLLSEKDMYGYEMIETLEKRSENVFELKAGTLYPLLHNLVSQGFLSCYEEDAGGKVRKYYHITVEGLRRLKDKEKEWKEYANAMIHVLGGVIYEGI